MRSGRGGGGGGGTGRGIVKDKCCSKEIKSHFSLSPPSYHFSIVSPFSTEVPAGLRQLVNVSLATFGGVGGGGGGAAFHVNYS